MFAKIYWYTWLIIVAVAGLLLVTGNMTNMAVVVFGFIAFGMIFAGMTNVLPWTLTHAAAEPLPTKEKERRVSAEAVPVPHGAYTVQV